MNWEHLTRRNVLAGLGATGAASVGGLALFTEPAVAFQNSVTLSTASDGNGGSDCRLEWVETYRGVVQETGNAESGSNGPIVSLSNVLPGDYGSLCFELTVEGPEDVDPRFAFRLDEELTGENGITEPEEKAGDTTASGELQNMVDVAVWYDEGLAGLDPFGSRNCSRDVGESLVDPDAEGSIASVADGLSDGISLTETCLSDGESVRIALRWEFADDADVNRAQSDTVGFDLDFSVESCGTG